MVCPNYLQFWISKRLWHLSQLLLNILTDGLFCHPEEERTISSFPLRSNPLRPNSWISMKWPGWGKANSRRNRFWNFSLNKLMCTWVIGPGSKMLRFLSGKVFLLCHIQLLCASQMMHIQSKILKNLKKKFKKQSKIVFFFVPFLKWIPWKCIQVWILSKIF